MPIAKLQQIVHAVEPAAQFVEPRILRRVIRLDRRLQGHWLLISQRKSYTIDRDRLLAFVDREELQVAPEVELPSRLVLLSGPDDPYLSERDDIDGVLQEYFHLLFYGCARLELEKHADRQASPDDWAAEKKAQIGEIEFAEIQAVLLKDGYLFHAPSELETYLEFAAVYLELRYFAPHKLPWYFPAIRDWHEIDRIVGQDIDHRELFDRLHEIEGVESSPAAERVVSGIAPKSTHPRTGAELTFEQFRRQQAKAARASAIGNSVKATLINWRAASNAPQGYEGEARAASLAELARFVLRLKVALQLSSVETEQWTAALQPLLAPAADGFWSNEARLLYDLQKVCVEQERGVYRLDLVAWIRSRAKRPLRRPLPLMRDALMLRHFATASRRVSASRIPPEDRERLTALLKSALARVETHSRQRLRTIIDGVLDEVGLQPHNVPERVARRKLIEELLDRIVERGYLSMGDLRDAFSKNDLKLPDVTALEDIAGGDQLLRADRKFETALDGVYRRGAIYQRWPQTLSSLVFGTKTGRQLTKYLFIPYGGAYLLVEFFRHVGALAGGPGHGTSNLKLPVPGEMPVEVPPSSPEIDWLLIGTVLSLGSWILLLIHRPEFREWNARLLGKCWRLARKAIIELPAVVINSESIQRMLRSRSFAIASNYLLWPGLLTYLASLVSTMFGYRWNNHVALEVFLIVALFLNSTFGRYVVEVTTDILMRTWHNLKMRVFAAIYQWIMDAFHGLLAALERMVYTVDEWLRFRTGDRGAIQVVKLAGGVVWFFVSYIVIFVFTLLVEPQINPIKHFPVVTVSHKLILPTGPAVANYLTPYLGRAEANTLVWTTIWLIPGVFGFLVWELKENWRLYAANRSRKLPIELIGRHGETMVQLLRPGFHSGTLPRAFAALRQALRKSGRWAEGRVHRRRLALLRVEEDVRRFVERELLYLFEESSFFPEPEVLIGATHLATNRIDIKILHCDEPHLPATLTWEELAGDLSSSVVRLGWIEELSHDRRGKLAAALAGLFQRSDVERIKSPLPIAEMPEFTWNEWLAVWADSSQSDLKLNALQTGVKPVLVSRPA